MSAWSQQITEELEAKIAEEELYIHALKIAFESSSVLNDIAIGRVLTIARAKGFDGRKILMKAFNERFGSLPVPSREIKNVVLEQTKSATSAQNTVQAGFQCPVCNKLFKSQAALSGHGINRCKG